VGAAPQLTQPLGVPLDQAPFAVALMLAAELVAFRGIAAGRRPVAHDGKLSRGEQLELPHG
jgi:hypothetical protein